MGAVNLQLHTFLTSKPDTLVRSNAYLIKSVDVKTHPFLNSAVENLSG